MVLLFPAGQKLYLPKFHEIVLKYVCFVLEGSNSKYMR